MFPLEEAHTVSCMGQRDRGGKGGKGVARSKRGRFVCRTHVTRWWRTRATHINCTQTQHGVMELTGGGRGVQQGGTLLRDLCDEEAGCAWHGITHALGVCVRMDGQHGKSAVRYMPPQVDTQLPPKNQNRLSPCCEASVVYVRHMHPQVDIHFQGPGALPCLEVSLQ